MYNLKTLEAEDLEAIRLLVGDYENKPYQYFRELRKEQLTDFVLEELGTYLPPSGDKYAFLAREGTEILGLATLRLLPWDKQIFKKEMASVPYMIAKGDYQQQTMVLNSLVSTLLTKCSELGVEHLRTRANTLDICRIHALEGAGFRLTDAIAIYYFDFAKFPMPVKESEPHFKIRSCEKRDIELIVALTKLSFQNHIDHFHLDPTLDNQNCDELYGEWARNCCLGVTADKVFVAEDDEGLAGFGACKITKGIDRHVDHKIGELELACISPRARGRGLYSSLGCARLNWLRGKVDFVQVATQANNTNALRVWYGLGFEPICAQVTFHRWF